MAKTRHQRVEAAAKAIEAFHKLGRTLKAAADTPADEGRKRVRATKSRGYETRRKAEQFATPEGGGFTVKEVNDLCEMIRKTQPEQDDSLWIVGKSHVERLMTVRNKVRRKRLQRESVDQGWSLRRLNQEISGGHGTRWHGGRRRKLPTDKTRLLAIIETECDRWRRLRTALDRPVKCGRKSSRPRDAVTDLMKQINEVAILILDIQEKAGAALKEKKRARVQRDLTEPETSDSP